MSQCSRQPEELQVGSHRHRKGQETLLGWSCGYSVPDQGVRQSRVAVHL